jgi:hypothetical protein
LACAAPASATCTPAIGATTVTVACGVGVGQSVSIPAGAGPLTFDVFGGTGGNQSSDPLIAAWGEGGSLHGTYAGPAAAYSLSVTVGQQGGDSPGLVDTPGGIPGGGTGLQGGTLVINGGGGGGGGGGYSSISFGATRLMLAGGGGGAGQDAVYFAGGAAGGWASPVAPNGERGGEPCPVPATCPTGGTQAAGGAPGSGGGTSGSALAGSDAGGNGGGGGGAGLFGGAGGGDTGGLDGTGGAGGSSFWDPALVAVPAATAERYPTPPVGLRNGLVRITYARPPAPPVPPAAPAPPQPDPNSSIVVERVTGTVLVRVPGSDTFVPVETLREIPEGSIVNATNGKVELTSSRGVNAGTQAAVFYGGVFKANYATDALASARRKRKVLITEAIVEGKIGPCPRAKKSASTAARRKKRRLWGRGRGRFRTRGRNSSATVRGTWWLVEDRCDGTLTRVREGSVYVRDYKRKKTVVVKKGKRYLARRR